MRNLCLLLGVFAFTLGASAQDMDLEVPRWEAFGGYSYIRADAAAENIDINLHGFNAGFTGNWNRWLGLTGEFSGNYTDTDIQMYTYLFGPRVAFGSRWRPFAHALFGGASARVQPEDQDNPFDHAFGMALGGGLDVGLMRNVALRGQLDYLYSQLQPGIISLNDRQHNFRVVTGIVFRFGGP
jgi:opacity protein-like surface antigen